MAVLNVYNFAGEQTGTVEVKDSIFAIEPNKTVLHEVLTAERAAARQGSAATKTRAMVRGGGRKPFRQKGTGRARQGSTRAPHMVGGGVTFGPQPRSYEKKVNKKVKALALKSALSSRAAAGELVVLDEAMDAIKTAKVATLLKSFDNKTNALILDANHKTDENIAMSSRNIKDVIVVPYVNFLTVYGILRQQKVVLSKGALAAIEEVLG